MIRFMKNIKNFAIYGSSVGSLSNICAADGLFGNLFDNFDLGDLGGKLVGLTDTLGKGDNEAGLRLLNEHIFSKPDNAGKLSNTDGVYYLFFEKEKGEGKKSENLFVLFHGLGQSLDNYDEEEINLLKNKFNADVLLIEYNLNSDKTNTFGDMDEYCKNVANLISGKNYKNNIFFGYSLGSFVGNLVRKHFNNINETKINNKEITSKYIGYKGIKDLENAGVSFIETFLGDDNFEITEKSIFNCINTALNFVGKKVSINNFSDLFKYLLGEKEYNEIKTLTNNALILKNTKGFDKEKVAFNDDLETEDHIINLGKDITSILNVFNNEENKDKDVFLFQVNGGDDVVGNGMADTYTSLIGKEPKKNPKNPKAKQKDGKKKTGDSTPVSPKGGQPQGGLPNQQPEVPVSGQEPDNKESDQKSGSCYGF